MTENAKGDNSYIAGRQSLRLGKKKKFKHTHTQHILLHRVGVINQYAVSQALCKRATFGQCASWKLVRDSFSPSQSMRGMVKLSVLTGVGVLGPGVSGGRRTTPPTFLRTSRSGHSERHGLRSPLWCSWLWADQRSQSAGCHLLSGCLCTSSCPCSLLRKDMKRSQSLTAEVAQVNRLCAPSK